jgi:hypothetical protein
MKNVETTTGVDAGVHNSHQRVNQGSNSPAGIFTRPEKSFRMSPTNCPLSAFLPQPALFACTQGGGALSLLTLERRLK